MTVRNPSVPTLPKGTILLAGAAGGLAEVLWVAAYAALMPLETSEVGTEVTISIFGIAASGSYAPWTGLLIHMLLACAVAAAFVGAIWRPVYARFGDNGVMAASLATLAAIWVMNFFVVLPAINPVFVMLMPLSVTFTSKMLFGAAMAAVLVLEARVALDHGHPGAHLPA